MDCFIKILQIPPKEEIKERISSVKSCRRKNSFFHIRIFNSLKVSGIKRIASIFVHLSHIECFFPIKCDPGDATQFFLLLFCFDDIQLSKFIFPVSVLIIVHLDH